MLDYAANAISFWKVETIRLRYESKFGNDSEQAKIDMDSKFENPVEYEDYWEKVDNHLNQGVSDCCSLLMKFQVNSNRSLNS